MRAFEYDMGILVGCVIVDTVKRAFVCLVEPFRVQVGWLNRVYVLLGTGVILTMRTWTEMAIYAVIWFGIYQLILASVYYRGQTYAYREMNGGEASELLEIALNSRLVALHDFAELCGKYGIPPEEVVPIVKRGFGVEILTEPNEPQSDS